MLVGRSLRRAADQSDLQLLSLVADNVSRERIATRLGCSKWAVDRRLARLRQVSGASTTIELAAAAARAGLI